MLCDSVEKWVKLKLMSESEKVLSVGFKRENEREEGSTSCATGQKWHKRT